MAGTPDLSGIVNLIMQNPALIEQISALAKQRPEAEAPESTEETVATETPAVSEPSPAPMLKSNRRDLINAMKPYLSESRQVAIDSMSSILDVIDAVMKK